MAHCRRDRPAGNLGVRNLDRGFDLVREASQPAAEDDAHARLEVASLADARDRGGEALDAHAEPSATRVSYRDTTSSTASATSSVLSREA